MSSSHRDTIMIALVSAGVAIVAMETLRRLTLKPTKKKLAPIPLSMFGRKLLEQEFALKPNYVFVNCGSYGHVPQRVLQEQMRLMNERESDPEAWYRFAPKKTLYLEASKQLAAFVGADPANLVIVENASTGTNTALKAIKLVAGDKILVNSHTYNAVLNNVREVEDVRGVDEVFIDLKLPLHSEDDVVSQFQTTINANPGIKVAIIDHITSPSAILMPVKRLVDLCHQKGIIVIVDGANAPGHVPLDLEELNADFYTGNIHKWLFAPRGCALLWVHPKHHDNTIPMIASLNHYKETLLERFIPAATRDSTAYAVVPTALDFHNALGGLDVILERNKALATAAIKMLSEAWGTEEYPVALPLRSPNMALVALPKIFQDNFDPEEPNCEKLMVWMHQRGVFAYMIPVSGKIWVRISAHVWNSMDDFIAVRDIVLEMVKDVPLLVKQ